MRDIHTTMQYGDRRGEKLVIAFLLCLSVAFIYGQTRHYPFVDFDDYIDVINNPQIQSGLGPQAISSIFTSFHDANWNPLSRISHAAVWSLFGENAGPHHIVNVLLHASNAVLLLLLLSSWTGKLWPSALVAGIFAVHPLHVESVAWITERKDVLSVFFGLMAMLAYGKYVKEKSFAAYLGMQALFACSLMSKPMLMTLPALLLALDYWPLGRYPSRARKQAVTLVVEKLPLFAMSVASALVSFAAIHQAGGIFGMELPLRVRLKTMLVGYATYIGRFLWPRNLVLLYPYFEPKLPLALAALAALALVSLAAVWYVKRKPWLAVGWFWFLLTLFPVSGIAQAGAQSTADRYLYFPMIGLSMMVAFGFADCLEARRRVRLHVGESLYQPLRIASIALAGCALIALGLSARRQVTYWRNTSTLYQRSLSVYPNNAMVRGFFGNLLEANGDFCGAQQNYLQVIMNGSQEGFGWVGFADALGRMGDAGAKCQQITQTKGIEQ